MAGILYIVPTPVGNLEDITLRAINVLKSVDLILAEDTRTSSVLLKHYDIHKPLRSHHKFNEHKASQEVVNELLAGKNIALVSDAGTPGISDPGFFLARLCAAEGLEVQTLPGATACIPALVSSGLPCDRFWYRVVKTLEQFAQYFGPDRQCSVAREISKKFEEHRRGTIAQVLAHFKEHEPKGEFVIIIRGRE